MSVRLPSVVLVVACCCAIGCQQRSVSSEGTSTVPTGTPSAEQMTDASQAEPTAPSGLPASPGGVGLSLPDASLPALPEPPKHAFIVDPRFSDCVHPEVTENCRDGWCRIPAGCFVMGSPEEEIGRAANAEEQARVTLTHDFEIQQTELTLEQWRTTGWADPNVPWGGSLDASGIPPCTDPQCAAGGTTWYQALQYANWLSEDRGLPPCFRVYDCSKDNDTEWRGDACSVELLAPSIYECEGYRLPTSAEWEYAARAGTTTAFYSGPITSFDDNYVCQLDPNLARVAWYCATTPDPQREQRVAQLLPNAWGLYDALGNVYEWVMDRSRGLPAPNPSTDLGASLDSGGSAIARGGQVNARHELCRVADSPGVPRDSRGVGLRLARTLGKGTLPTLADVPKP